MTIGFDERRREGLSYGARARRASGPAVSPRAWRAAATEGVAATLGARGAGYQRARTLPRLIAIEPRELDIPGPALDEAIRTRLERALRAERGRGRAGHWTYDLNRHLALLQALSAEEASTRRSDAERRRRSAAPETKSAARMLGRR